MRKALYSNTPENFAIIAFVWASTASFFYRQLIVGVARWLRTEGTVSVHPTIGVNQRSVHNIYTKFQRVIAQQPCQGLMMRLQRFVN